MRALKLTFKNINSLAGEWSIDFTHPDYSDYGIFLIAGPTGAGKSTILDAITLALYGRTPRVQPTMDSCEFMTRGRGDCRAELIFETPQGRFRSYWGRDSKKDGRLNPPKREFENLETKRMETKAEEIKALMAESKIPGYDQFVRSALLAQGEFKKFLDSDDNGKSAILESLTDSAIYTELSCLAFEKEKEERKRKEALLERLDSVSVLTEEEAADKKRRAAECGAEARSLAQASKDFQSQINWLEKISALRADAAGLEKDRLELGRRLEEFQPRKAALEAGRRAREYEPEFTLLERVREDARSKREKLEKSRKNLQRLAEDLKTALLEKELAARKEAECQNKYEAEKPKLERARLLDRSIAEKSAETAKRTLVLAEYQARRDNLLTARAALENERERLKKGLADALAGLAEDKGGEWLSENRGGLKAEIKSLEDLAGEIAEAEARLKGLKKDITEKEGMIGETDRELAEGQGRLGNVRKDLEDINEGLAAFLGGSSLTELERELGDKYRELAEAKGAVRLEEYRKSLAPEQPCPLCGALDHPYMEGKPLPDADAKETECRNLAKKIEDIKGLEAGAARWEKMESETRHSMELAQARRKSLEEALGGLQKALLEEGQKLAAKRGRLSELEAGVRADLAKAGFTAAQTLEGAGGLLDQRFEAWRKKIMEKEGLEKTLADLEPKLSANKANLDNGAENAAKANEEREGLEKELDALRAERRGLLASEDPDEAERALKRSLEAAAQAARAAMGREAGARGEYDKESGLAKALSEDSERLEADLRDRERAFAEALAKGGWNEEGFLKSRLAREELESLEAGLKALEKAGAEISRLCAENKARLIEEEGKKLTDKPLEALREELEAAGARRDQLQEEKAGLNSELLENEKRLGEKERLMADFERQKAEWEKWRGLSGLIGSEKGDKFRNFAQNITLDILLARANQYLAKIRDRYALQRTEDAKIQKKGSHFLDIEVLDRYLDDQKRPVGNLSGGETFIVSLALALGLAEMSGRQSLPGSLFLDEGFGSLDEETLKTAIDTISALSAEEGRLIGIISHVEALRHKNAIYTKIFVEPDGKGASVLKGPGVSRG